MLAHALMEAEVETHVGAAPHESTATRTGQRNGYRERAWDTRVGTIDLRVPRVRDGSYAPSLLEPRRRAEQALASVVRTGRTSPGSRRAGSTTWYAPSGWTASVAASAAR